MKNHLRFFGLFSLLVLFAVTTGYAQTGKVYHDNFSKSRDYLTEGVTGTIWDGFTVNKGTVPVATSAVVTALNTKDVAGALSFSTNNSAFAGDNDNGAFLYKNIKADADFMVTFKIVGGDFPSLGATAVPYLMAGALARRPDTLSFLATQAFDQYSVGYALRSIPAELSSTAAEENWTGTNDDGDDLTVQAFPWIKLIKKGTKFTASCSADSVTWFEYQVNERPDLKGHALQVGLYDATYTENEGKAIFDNFTLVDYSEGGPVVSTDKVYHDNFSKAKDYLTEGVAGTIWDGFNVNKGTVAVVTDAVVTALNTKDVAGALSFSTNNSAWAGDNDNGAFLYKNVAADADFVVTFKVVGGDFPSLGATAVPYLMAGALARRPDTLSFLATQVFDQYSVGYALRSIPAELSSTAAEENWTGTNDDGDDLTVQAFPWVKLAKTGTKFTASCSADSVSWFEYQVNERPDLKGHALQVGLYDATYTENEGKAIFDNFTLVVKSGVTAIKPSLAKAETVKVYSANNQILITGTEMISSVRVISIAGSTIYEKRNLNVPSFEVPISKTGVYITIVESAGQRIAKKVIVK